MTANELSKMRTAAVIGVLAGVLFGLAMVQPVAAGDMNFPTTSAAVDEQTVPEPADPQDPGDASGEGVVPGGDGVTSNGETAVADGGNATPWVIAGIGVLLALALAAAIWSARKPRRMDLEGGAHDVGTSSDHRYIPPGL